MPLRFPRLVPAIVALALAPLRGDPTPAPAGLRVGLLVNDPPFSSQADGRWTGLSLEIWNGVAREAAIQVTWVPVRQISDIPRAFAEGKIDVGPAIGVTSGRLRQMDFSLPILSTGLGIATVESPGLNWRWLYAQLRASGLFYIVGGAVVMGFALWRIERGRNPAFGGKASEGLLSGIWCTAVTMTTVGYGDKVPLTAVGRLLCLLVMLSGVVLISMFTATISSTLTVFHLRARVQTIDDLRHARSVAIAGTEGEAYLRRHDLPLMIVGDSSAARLALEEGKAQAFVHNRLKLLSGLRSHAGDVLVLPINLEEQFYAYPVATGDARKRWLDLHLQAFLDSNEWDSIESAYLER